MHFYIMRKERRLFEASATPFLFCTYTEKKIAKMANFILTKVKLFFINFSFFKIKLSFSTFKFIAKKINKLKTLIFY